MFALLAVFTWDPDRIFFVVPGVNHPITWYGILFAFGFLGGYGFIRLFLKNQLIAKGANETAAKKEATQLADRLTVLTVLGTVIGARLGHVFFYGWPYYRLHLLEIFQVWQGGLASHGAAVGILVALFIFTFSVRSRASFLTFKATLDLLMIPAAFAGGCIRLGNFINQEILGQPTQLPWGVIFLHPIEGIAGIPLHPVQIYEALFYFSVCGFLYYLWKKTGKTVGQGVLAAWFFILVFGFRFFIEFLKLPQSQILDETASLNMGQWLSIPFVLVGIFLLVGRHYRMRSSES